ncbi:hypothetical protein [Bacillus sp. FJAT-29814]|uniref:hypothetical protein n=1 Tax=Bacillus sp. FJAT-29814 TaxID=1729688 RepID=UPI0008302759|nr:hypothetical protein [Bacillus sp. FJAT-29814]
MSPIRAIGDKTYWGIIKSVANKGHWRQNLFGEASKVSPIRAIADKIDWGSVKSVVNKGY